MINKSKQGFTLIEILIVVAIIAILASVVLVGLGPTQRAGRDARRISDLRQAQTGLELYYNKCGYYPGAAQAGATCGNWSNTATWAGVITSLTGSNIGVTNVPNDPRSGTNYLYGTNGTGSGYTVGATLEDGANAALTTDIDANPSNGVNCTDPVYCVQL